MLDVNTSSCYSRSLAGVPSSTHLLLGEQPPGAEAADGADQGAGHGVHHALPAGVVAHVRPAAALAQEHRRVAAGQHGD